MTNWFCSQRNSEQGQIDHDYQVIGLLGGTLAAFGIIVLVFAAASFAAQ